MLTPNNIDARMSALSHTTSDLLVGLKCLDAPEVERMARRLKEQANEYGASQLEMIAHNLNLAAVALDLDAAQLLVPELNECLLQARESMHRFSAKSHVSQKYAALSIKA